MKITEINGVIVDEPRVSSILFDLRRVGESCSSQKRKKIGVTILTNENIERFLFFSHSFLGFLLCTSFEGKIDWMARFSRRKEKKVVIIGDSKIFAV